jgi:hypothetical protein
VFNALAALHFGVLPCLSIVLSDAAASMKIMRMESADWPLAMSLLAKCLAVVIKSDLEEFCSQYYHKLP